MGLLSLLTSAIVTDPVRTTEQSLACLYKIFNRVQHDIRYKLRNAPNACSQQRVISKQYNAMIGEVPVTDALSNSCQVHFKVK